MKTEVCITIDTEFSIAGAFSAPQSYTPLGERSVTCDIGGQEHGLGFLLALLSAHRIPATFFVEALNSFYFGDGPMGRIVDRIAASGHDVQLHVHPCWLAFRNPDWQSEVARSRPNDSCAGRLPEEMKLIIQSGLDAFRRWGMPRPIALRTGSLHADRTVYRAVADLGIPLSSNIGLGIYRPADRGLHLYGGRHWIDGVLEVPVLSFHDFVFGKRRYDRTLTVTGTSAKETESLLWAARRSGVSPVVILTHPPEYVKAKGFRYDVLRPNRVNRRRLENLVRFLNANDGDFTPVTFAARKDAWLRTASTGNPDLTVPPLFSIVRAAENCLSDHVWHY